MNEVINELFDLIELDFDFGLAYFSGLYCDGGVYSALEELCENKNLQKDIHKDIKEWEKDILEYINSMKGKDILPVYVDRIKEAIVHLLNEKSEVENQVSIDDIISRINVFIKRVDNVFIPDIKKQLEIINKQICKASHDNVWNKIHDFVITKRNVIRKAQIDFIKFHDEYLSNKVVKNEENQKGN